jgi:hypothetical protein
VAADVHYLASIGARTTAIVAADAAFAHVTRQFNRGFEAALGLALQWP